MVVRIEEGVRGTSDWVRSVPGNRREILDSSGGAGKISAKVGTNSAKGEVDQKL